MRFEPPRLLHPHLQGEKPPAGAAVVNIGSGTRYWNRYRPAPPLDMYASEEDLLEAFTKYRRAYMQLQTAPHLGLEGHLLVCDCSGVHCHGAFILEAAQTRLEYRSELSASNAPIATAQAVQGGAKVIEAQAVEIEPETAQKQAPKFAAPRMVSTYKPESGREYLGRAAMSKRAGISLRSLDYYRAQGLLRSWFVKGKNRVYFDVLKTLEELNAF